MSAKAITGAINTALRKRYCAPAWSLLFNVSDATGFNGSRYADAIAMSVWPSRGLELHGFEVKASRADWQKELATPRKAEEIAAYCDHWWLVSNKLVAKEDEIPPAWGWIEFDDGKLTTRKQSVKTEAKPMTRAFLAALLRRAGEADEALVQAAIEAEKAERDKKFAARVEREVSNKTYEYKSLRESVEKFEAASGVKIDDWGGEKIGGAVKAVLAAGVLDTYGGIFQVAENTAKVAQRIFDALAEAGYEKPERLDLAALARKRA